MTGRFFKILTFAIVLTTASSFGRFSSHFPTARAIAEVKTPTASQHESINNSTSSAGQPPPNPSRAAREEKALQDARRQLLAEKEAQLAAKEQELKKLSAKIESQIKTLDESKKRMDESLKSQSSAQKKAQDEKAQKMVKLFKTIKGDQAGKLIDAMKEDMALSLMSRLDTKTIAKLTPFINQPRVLKWITNNLQ